MIAIDLPGTEAKVSATTMANQPQATRAKAPAILPIGRSRLPSIVIKMLDVRAPVPEIAVDIDKAVDPSLQAGPAKARSGVEIERKQFGGALHIERRGFRRDHGDEDFVVARDLGKA